MRAVVQEETLNSNNGFTTVCGHTIGRYAFIGAGAVVINPDISRTEVAADARREV